jgi:hypothetical protein
MKVTDLFEGWEANLAAENRAKAKQEKEHEKWVASLKAKPISDAKRLKAVRQDDRAIFAKVERAVESMFDGVDPIDQLIPWMERTGITMDDINRAVAKYEGRGKKKFGMYDWMKEMWNDTAADRAADARHQIAAGQEPDDSEFYNVDKNNKVTVISSPW